ncbi:MAG: hypothetical protein CR988_03000 [Treponema sp.]|nr:MAG: hypothetical protein CR988_03000 [Treponema sp.]
MKSKVLIFFISLGLLSFFSCASFQKDIMYSSELKEKTVPKLNEIEKRLITQYIENDKTELAEIEIDLTQLLNTPSTDSNYLAKLNAIYADFCILKRKTSKAKKYAAEAIKYNNSDEYAILVNSRLMKPQDKQLDYLKTALETFPNYYRLRAELGDIFYQKGEYALAIAAFDASLPFLPKVYTNLYKEKRNSSYSKYMLGDDVDNNSEDIIAKSQISLLDMTALAQDNTNAFDTITGNTKWKTSMLADRLKASGWYRANVDLPNGKTRRKDAAIFLWHLLVGTDSKKLSKYSRRYETKTKSPIVDVPIGSEFFDAVLGLVEEDIIPLINGKFFNPESDVNGYDFFEWLKKAEDAR